MNDVLIYPAGVSGACTYAASELKRMGYALTDHPTPDATHLLLDVPSSDTFLPAILEMLPSEVTLIGGNLPLPGIDLLKDADYLAQNAAITAQCALIMASKETDCTYVHLPVLVIGAGRIGLHLVHLLRAAGADVTVLSHDSEKSALLRSLGIDTVSPAGLSEKLPAFRLILNTAPSPVLSAEHCALCRDCVFMDLASRPGIDSPHAISARGLPGKYAPRSSGQLIARTIDRLLREGTK